jgi:hypothetical protein
MTEPFDLGAKSLAKAVISSIVLRVFIMMFDDTLGSDFGVRSRVIFLMMTRSIP